MEELQPRRGRPPKYQEVAQAAGVPSEPQAARPARRKPFGSMEQKLAYAERPGFHRHWFNDVPGRIDRAKEAGYENVKDKDGNVVVRNVGIADGGGPLRAYLMEIPQEWYQEDMKAQQNLIDEREQQIKRGELEAKEGDGRYVPSQGISIRTSKK